MAVFSVATFLVPRYMITNIKKKKHWYFFYLERVSLLCFTGGYRRKEAIVFTLSLLWQPWVCLPKPIQLEEGCSLLPASAQAIRIFVTTFRSAGIPRFAILSANHKNVVDLDSGSLPVSTSDSMTSIRFASGPCAHCSSATVTWSCGNDLSFS
jgi:hypothetical protein